MRLRLFHQLFLLIAATALIAALAMAAILSLNLRRGFGDYLVVRDGEQLDAFAASASDRLKRSGRAAANLPTLIRDMAADGNIPEAPPPGAPPPRPGWVPGMGPPPPGDRDDRHGHRPPPEGFGVRLMLFDAANRQLYGPPPPARQSDLKRVLARPIRIDGTVVATARLLPRAPAGASVDARFLRSQYIGAALLAGLLIALAALPAWGLARLGARRLEALKGATSAVAEGDLAWRVEEAGHDEVSDVARNVNVMAEKLQRLDSARRRWLAEISHELRTPLTAMRGELEALEDGIRPLDAAAITSLQAEVSRLGGLVDDLHFLAVTDLAAPPFRFTPNDAVAACAATVARFAAEAKAVNIDLRFDPDGLTRLAVHWDAARIDQLLTNLLVNSLRYTDPPGKIWVRLVDDSGVALLTVDDSAPGVAADHLAHLFEPLYRVDTARDRDSGGSGLGMAIAEAVVRGHRGTIAASASPLGGLRVAIRLPLDPTS